MSDGCQWVHLQRGDPIPETAIIAGSTSSDGRVWVGRLNGAAGKINADHGTMWNYWMSGSTFPHREAEILCCTGDHFWLTIERDWPIPPNAVKAGVNSADGACYVGRFNGEAGKINTQNDAMYNFWSHSNGKQTSAEILVTGEPPEESADVFLRSAMVFAVNASSSKGAEGYPSEEPAIPTASPNKSSLSFRLMQFNIWNECKDHGCHADAWEQMVDVVLASNSDIIAFSEVRNWGGDFHNRVKSSLRDKHRKYYGCFAEGGDVGLISRWPIDRVEQVTSAKRSSITAYFLRTPRQICVCSAHLDWKEYALNSIRGYDGNTFLKLMGGPITDVSKIMGMDEASGRRQALQDFVDFTSSLPKDMPVFLAGDFNECSHLDWTEETKNLFGHNGLVIPWGHSKILEAADFQDTWRTLYPDPATQLGATWPAFCSNETHVTSWAKSADERDRIDFVYHNCRGIEAKNAQLVGPESYYVFGKKEPAESQGPFLETTKLLSWPSDHNGIVVDFVMSLDDS